MIRYFARRRQQAELLVIGALTEGALSGFTLMQRTGLGPGRMHVALARLEGTGRVKSDWADGPSPRRRMYRLAEPKPPTTGNPRCGWCLAEGYTCPVHAEDLHPTGEPS